ncbi:MULTISPECIES: hypothetical protein [unclassified Paenibacillus]|uniref:hypothetical protein n=1 Tax=unclassified Paenibacillus TaxID=185978 RepID=UPI000407122B|nr:MULTISPECIES: hypothetical protein [unclassified Paenibacillus]KGP85287.1 hypothetical protein P364_0101325 [Paenibacillus sp. MAEPY2]KGP88140.1 hypothetical protein P363_0108240 [Paenibacillus sp. MAEPY1]
MGWKANVQENKKKPIDITPFVMGVLEAAIWFGLIVMFGKGVMINMSQMNPGEWEILNTFMDSGKPTTVLVLIQIIMTVFVLCAYTVIYRFLKRIDARMKRKEACPE